MNAAVKPIEITDRRKPGSGPVRASRPVYVHLGVLLVAFAASAYVWTREKQPLAASQGDVTVWTGRSASVDRIVFESKSRKVELSSKQDSVGRYFVGNFERVATPPAPGADGGAPPKVDTKPPMTFVSVGPGEKVAEAFGPLKALRNLGRVDPARAAEFGLADPEATVTVRVGGVDHRLLVGSTAPGGGDRYVREPTSGEIYVLRGEPIRSLESADTLLLERDLHEWKDADVTRAQIQAGTKTREIVRGGPEGKRFWADRGAPETNDETLGNWMSKLDRLRPTDFVAIPPEPSTTVLRVEYAANRPLGFVEIIKTTGGEKPAYFLRTERTRLLSKLTGQAVEQVEQDLGTLVK